MKKKHEEFAEIELFPEIFSEEKLEEEKKERFTLCQALSEALTMDDLDFELIHEEDGTEIFVIKTFNPITIHLIDGRYVEFCWESEVLTEVIPTTLLNEITVLKSRISYQYAAPRGRKLMVEFSLLSNQANTDEFAENVLLNSLFFVADINQITKYVHSDS